MMATPTYDPDHRNLLDEIKRKYFPVTNKLHLETGEVLHKEGDFNNRLYLIKAGAVQGVIYRDNEPIELFSCEQDMFVGVYSFFSDISKSYSTVVATEPTELLYITREQLREMNLDLVEFNEHFLPIIVNELHNRQEDAQTFYDEKQDALKKLVVQEKLAALGQLSAGLAHELNNAVAVLNQKVDNFSDKLIHALADKGGTYKQYLLEASQGNQLRTTKELRKIKERIQQELKGISNSDAKKLANIVQEDDLYDKHRLKELAQNVQSLFEAWSLGRDLYDMRVASDHASHIVASVKTLAAPKKHTELVEIQKSVEKSLTLLQNQVKHLDVSTSFEPGLYSEANEGDLIQIWMNLIKNAAESLIHAQTEDPKIVIKSSQQSGIARVVIEDNGPGIPADKQAHIFSPSFTTKVGGLTFGLGLGLSIVESLVNSYRGEIKLNSEPGKTIFVVTLPLKQNG